MTSDICTRPHCNGKIDDGYCDSCGMAALSQNLVTATSRSSSSTSSRQSGSLRSGSLRSGSLRSGRASSRHLGAGLVTIPDLPSTAPEAHLLSDPHVPEHRRFCGHCNATLRRERGYCNQCGQKYSFVPSLQAGDLVAEQYEVKGAMAYGGLGWIYLGFDQMLSRYVVLKGLLNAEDAASAAVALAERKFLASVKHPNIVGVYNFVNHGGEGFIVMEYIQGQTLKVIRKQRGRLPVGEAIAYIHRILSAFAYLHESGLVYCDFKPDNAMLEDGDVKLIDMGGVRRLDDSDGDIYGTVGYSAPEIAADGPSVASDLFTVGRTLAVLLIDIPEFNKTHQFSLPAPEQEPLFAQQESLYRFLLKATAYKAEQRFQSAEAMAEQLLGVLREVAALETGQPSPASSRLFGGDPLVLTASPDAPIAADYHQLSLPLLDAADPAFNALLTALAVPDLRQRQVSLDQVMQQFPDSSEAQLQRINNLIELRNYKQARAALGKFMQKVQRDWRFTWCYGKLNLAEELPVSATDYFEQIYTDLPGELAPKLALAIATEQAGQRLRAIQLYRLIASTDPGYVSASFGLARCLFAKGDRQAAIAALGQIPSDSILYTHAQMMAVRLLTSMTGAAGTVPQPPDLEQATRILEALRLEGLERHRLAQQLFETALMLLHSKAVPPQNSLSLLGQPWTEVAIRQGLEQSLRAQAQLAAGREKIKLVDAANRIRPLTWI